MSEITKCADCGHSLESHSQDRPTSKIYKCSECTCEVKGDPYLRKTSFRKISPILQKICSICLTKKPIIYDQSDSYQENRSICQECYNMLKQ